MADFKTAYDRTSKFEGGYCNDEADNGGETFAGVARNYHESWLGWKIIDQYKTVTSDTKTLNKVLLGNDELMSLVEDFYKREFWDKIKGDKIMYQTVANNIYDMAVNSGVGMASKFAQRIVGVEDDGVIGDISIKAINEYHPNTFIFEFKRARGEFYQNIVAHNPSQSVFIDGWLRRNQEA